MQFRPWHQSDNSHLKTLLDPAADPIWINQFHGLHGPDREGVEWCRTRVAIDPGGQMIGCATITLSALHGGRLPCAIEVAPHARRRGIGRALIAEMKALRISATTPLSTKVRQRDTAAMAFVSAVEGRAYQCSPGVVINVGDSNVQRWAESRSSSFCRSLEGISPVELSRAFAALYEWIHRPWSPVTSNAVLTRVAALEVADVDRACSAGVWSGGRLVAIAFAFPAAEGFEVVAETTRGDADGGLDAVADAVAMVIRSVRRRGGLLVSFDSHMSDPHLQPVLARLPHTNDDPRYLVEFV